MALWTLASVALAQTSELPAGFGGVSLGDKWENIEAQYTFRTLDETASPWDRHAQECGYRSAIIEADKGELLVTVNNFRVTHISFVTPIKEGSDLLAVADLVMKTYGQPDRASMRNVLGRVTIDKDQVNHVTLEYRRPRTVEFTISGRELWQYRIKVRLENFRWQENKTLRCARDKAKAAREAAAEAARQQGATTTTQ